MKVKINGTVKEIDEGATLEGLLDLFGIKRQGIAVELNREIVPKRAHGQTLLKDGDAVEVVRMAGGG
ncbi:MAG: sulfur carrier protein ThiS [Deltaproteobacteria bacterium]|nr:sulfur carrier protein ThiS [Deltaproteobacteria bacterium]